MICPELENRLRSMGLTSRYQGYACLVQAVLLIRADPAMLDMPAKLLYPRLARLTGLSAGGVDRAIRTAIAKDIGDTIHVTIQQKEKL